MKYLFKPFAFGLLAALLCLPGHGQTYPTKTIRLVVLSLLRGGCPTGDKLNNTEKGAVSGGLIGEEQRKSKRRED
jgi:hypothetical protein